MSVVVSESIESRESSRGTSAEQTRLYNVTGSADQDDILDALDSGSPSTVGAGTVTDPYLQRRTIKTSPIFVDVDDPDNCIWKGTVTYSRNTRNRPVTGDNLFSFDTTGGTEHITASRETMGVWTPSGQASSGLYSGLIGVKPDGTGAEGVDIGVPVYSWSETWYLEDAYVTDSYKRTLFWLTNTVNGWRFRNFDTGEVLFKGAVGSQRTEDWEIQFRFAASPNRRGVSFGGGLITGVNKRGWEYLWVMQRASGQVQTVAGKQRLLSPPEAVIVERVYDYGDFSQLGIGS